MTTLIPKFKQSYTGAQNQPISQKLSERVSVFDFMTAAQIADVKAGTLSVNVTTAIQAAITAVAGNIATPSVVSGGILYFPTGSYLVNADSILIEDVQSLTIMGEVECISQEKLFGTNIVCATVGDYLIRVKNTSTNITFQNLILDGQAKVTTVLDVNNDGLGDITDYSYITNVMFNNVKASGSLLSFNSPSATYAETAIWRIENCGFSLNGLVNPASKGTAIDIANFGAWGIHISHSHFDGQSLLQTIRLYAGLLYLDSCQFDNNSTAGTYDINMWSSAGITVTNTNSGSEQPFINTQVKVVSGVWDNYPIIVMNCTQTHPFSLPATSIIHTTTNPLRLINYKSAGISITGTPETFTSINSPAPVFDLRSTATFSQKAGASGIALGLLSDNLQNYLAMYQKPTDGSTGWNLKSFGTSGYSDLNLECASVSIGAGTNGYLRLFEVTTPSAPGADGGSLFVKDNGAGKSQLCVRFNTGAVQVIATEP